MIQKFKKYIQKENLFQEDEKILLAVSGGIDSVVMCHLFDQANFNFGIAHCNFKLRGKDSEEDALFVKNLAKQFQVPFYDIEFNTEDFAKENNLSIQVAARELRYDWFEKIRTKNDFHFIATAHHLDDSLETIFYNFTKGCGIRGLHGILPKNKKVIRPLLFLTKKEIEDFSHNNTFTFREDASNSTDKYARNKIRQHVIPLLQSINPAFQKTGEENIQRLKATEKLFDFAIEKLKSEICTTQDDQLFIDIEKLKISPAPATFLFEILSPLGFNNSHTQQMIETIDHQSGAIFHSPSHQVLRDRNFFIVKKNTSTEDAIFLIEENQHSITFPNGQLIIERLDQVPSVFPKEKNHSLFDLEKISFPLTLRRWKDGDHFQPFGMNGQSKKLKDFLKDLKLNRFEKENIWVLESGEKIIWVTGLRTSEDSKIDLKTQKILSLKLK